MFSLTNSFDYGNSEVNDRDDGCGTMEAIYFGNGEWLINTTPLTDMICAGNQPQAHWHGNTGAGKTGPWAGADLEQGMVRERTESPQTCREPVSNTRRMLAVPVLWRWRQDQDQQ